MENKTITHIIKNILFLIVFFIIIACIVYILRFDVISGDDVSLGFFREDNLSDIIHCDHGRYLSSLQQKIFSVLGAIFNIHPNCLVNTLGGFIRGFDVAVFCLVLALFPYLSKKTTILTPVFMAIAFIFYIKQLVMYNFDEIQLIDFHFGYCCGSMLYLAFWLIIGVLLFKYNKLDKKLIFLIYCLAFFASLSDTYAFSGIPALLILNIYLIFNTKKNLTENNSLKVTLKTYYETYKHVVIMSSIFIMGALLAIKGMMGDEHVVNFIDEDASGLSYWLNMLKLFIPVYIKKIFLEHWQPLSCILVLIALILKTKDENKFTYVIYSLSLIVGIMCFMFSLVTGGTETFYRQGEFWISHVDLQLFYNMALIASLLALWGFWYNLLENKIIKVVSVIIAIFLVFIATFKNNYSLNHIQNVYTRSVLEREAMYRTEKIYLFYTYRNEEAILPISTLSFPGIASAFWVGVTSRETGEILSEYERNANNEDWEDRDAIVSKIKQIDLTDARYRQEYIRKIYKLKEEDIKPYKFDDDEIVYERFHNDGGAFSEEEIKNIDFNRLMNKNFVLNKS